MLSIVASYYCMQFQEKVIIQIQENGEELHFGPNLGTLNSNLDAKIFLFKNMAFSGTRYNGKLSSRTISEKSNDPILGKFSHRRKDGRTDGQTDESDFIGRCSTNVERPINVSSRYTGVDSRKLFKSIWRE